ncbi:MAG: hypothetical protein AB1781_02040 [Pseudomonadota bacterium]
MTAIIGFAPASGAGMAFRIHCGTGIGAGTGAGRVSTRFAGLGKALLGAGTLAKILGAAGFSAKKSATPAPSPSPSPRKRKAMKIVFQGPANCFCHLCMSK